MSKNNEKPSKVDKAIYPEDKDWANYTVNLHDGWADDVSLVYPDESWKPDEEELTQVNIDVDEINAILAKSEQNNNEDSSSTTKKRKKKLISKFTIFLIVWAISISVIAGILLFSYYDYLTRYEAAYEASRPETVTKSCIDWFISNDVDSIFTAITTLPTLNEFESDIALKTYIAQNNPSVSNNHVEYIYSKTKNYTYDIPEYTITAKMDTLDVNNSHVDTTNTDATNTAATNTDISSADTTNIDVTLALRKVMNQTDEYGFPKWYISYFSYDFSPRYDVTLIAPENAIIYINSIMVSPDYCTGKTNGKLTYCIKDFYSSPSIVAFESPSDSDKQEIELDVFYDEANDIYEIK